MNNYPPRIAALAVLLTLGGCQLIAEEDLVDFKPTAMKVSWWPAQMDWPSELGASPSDKVYVTLEREERDGCGRLSSDVQATINGVAFGLEASEIGLPRIKGGGWVCPPARFVGPRSALQAEVAGLTTIEIRDGSATLSAVLRNAGIERRLTLQAPGATVAIGAALRLVWTPATDVIDQVKTLSLALQGKSEVRQLSAQVKGNQIVATIDASIPTGDYSIELWHSGRCEVVSCSGVASCETEVYLKHLQSFSVVAPK